jgi:DNA-binding CsgD family transcriptional regulator
VRNSTDSQPGGGAASGIPSPTPRQRQILDLAARGFSDKEIGQKLGVTHRTVRTHLENLYRDRGIRNRSQAIALWSGNRSAHHEPRPADECPYPKPFPPDFHDCPAYQATTMVALDISHRPLGSVLTCRHLVSKLMPKTDYRWYGGCLVGDAMARRRWSESVGVHRLQDISALRQEVSALSAPFVQRLWELKGLQQSPAVIHQIQGTVDEFMTKMTMLLRERRQVLDELHLPLDACIRLLRIAIDRFVERGLSETDWEVPDEVLKLFPDDVRSYFRPQQTTPSYSQPPKSTQAL